MGRSRARRGGPLRNLAREQEAVQLREQGLTLVEIGRRLGITGQSVGNALRRQGRGDLLGVSGFAGISPERRQEIASMGGKAARTPPGPRTRSPARRRRLREARAARRRTPGGPRMSLPPKRRKRRGGRAGGPSGTLPRA
jgi:hypothetical protein